MHVIQIISWIVAGAFGVVGALFVLFGYSMSDNPSDDLSSPAAWCETVIIAAVAFVIGKIVSFGLLWVLAKIFGLV